MPTDQEVRTAKNLRTKARNATRKADRLAKLAARPKYTPVEQLKRLDERFGAGQGAAKERKKLAEKIAAET